MTRCANKFNEHGTDDNDRPPILGITGRASGKVESHETHRSTRKALQPVVESTTRADATVMTDEWHAYDLLATTGRGHSTVNHLAKEWARNDDRDGVREVHTNTIEGHWTGLRNFLQLFRGVHKRYLGSTSPSTEACTTQGRRPAAPRHPSRANHLDGPMSRFPYPLKRLAQLLGGMGMSLYGASGSHRSVQEALAEEKRRRFNLKLGPVVDEFASFDLPGVAHRLAEMLEHQVDFNPAGVLRRLARIVAVTKERGYARDRALRLRSRKVRCGISGSHPVSRRVPPKPSRHPRRVRRGRLA